MRHLYKRPALLAVLAALCLALSGCSGPEVWYVGPQDYINPIPDSAPAPEQEADSIQPAEPEPETEPQPLPPAPAVSVETGGFSGWQIRRDVNDLTAQAPPAVHIAFRSDSTPYTEQEQRDLAQPAYPTGGASHLDESITVPRVVLGNLCIFEEDDQLPTLLDCPLNGQLLSVCVSDEQDLYLLTTDGQLWQAENAIGRLDKALQNTVHLVDIPGIASHQLDPAWAVTYADGNLFWFGYGDQIIRMHLVTGRIEEAQLSHATRTWMPVGTDAIYYQYLLEAEGYCPTYSLSPDGENWYAVPEYRQVEPGTGHSGTNVSLPAGHALYSFSTGQETTPTPSSLLLMQRSKQLFPRQAAEGTVTLSYDDYMAQHRTVPLYHHYQFPESYAPTHDRTVCYPFYFDEGRGIDWNNRRAQVLGWESIAYEIGVYLCQRPQANQMPQLWCNAHISIVVQPPQEISFAAVSSVYYYNNRLYWVDQHKLYMSDIDLVWPQLIWDFEQLPGALPEAESLLPALPEEQFSGPLLWHYYNGRLCRVYLPELIWERMPFDPAENGLTYRTWYPTDNHTVVYAGGSQTLYFNSGVEDMPAE